MASSDRHSSNLGFSCCHRSCVRAVWSLVRVSPLEIPGRVLGGATFKLRPFVLSYVGDIPGPWPSDLNSWLDVRHALPLWTCLATTGLRLTLVRVTGPALLPCSCTAGLLVRALPRLPWCHPQPLAEHPSLAALTPCIWQSYEWDMQGIPSLYS